MISKGIVTAAIILVGVFLIMLVVAHPKSKLNITPLDKLERKHFIIICIALVATVLVCTLPMGLSPMYNGEIHYYIDEYEKTARAFLEGHLYIDNGDVSKELLAMENPYDYYERVRLGVDFQWDHAFYNGHYYMYFGVAPVFLLFIPFRLITGTDLTGYHATQIFTAFFILAVFLLFRLFAKKFFKNLSLSAYIFMSVSFSIMSVWYAVAAPALYCTAIMSALCVMIWGIYWFFKAVYDTENENKAIALAGLGSFCSALTFACRPSIALANVVVLPLLITFLRQRKISFGLIIKLVLAALPYVVIGVLLMAYNNARFDSPFEFGQTYQLTITDQSNYADAASRIDLLATIKGVYQMLFKPEPASEFVNTGSFITFPVLCFTLIPWLNKKVWKTVKEEKLFLFLFFLYLAVAMIIFIDVLWSPVIIARYKMDIVWLMSIIDYLMIGIMYKNIKNKAAFSYFIMIISMLTIIASFILFLYPYDNNFTIYYADQIEQEIGKSIRFN